MKATVSEGRWHVPARARAVGSELVLVTIAGLVYVVVRLMTEGSPERALANARELVAIERSIGLHHEHAVQSLILDRPWLRTAANWMYIWGHWPVISVAAIVLWFCSHDNYVRLRNAIFASGMIGFLLFALVPMAPPRLTDHGYVDSVTVWSHSYRALQPPHYTNLYAAMPSLHFGWDLLVGIAIFASTHNWAVRAIGVMLPICMAFAVVATGNHWILDVIVAVVVVAAGALVAAGLRAAVEQHRSVARREQPVRTAATASPQTAPSRTAATASAREPAR